MQAMRIYLDTSVFGGCLDNEFSEDSNRLISAIQAGQFVCLISDLILDELAQAPQKVRKILDSLPPEVRERVELSAEILALRDGYLAANILGERFRADATHVAAATVAGADAIVSWNFRHIVRLDKIKAYNQVNLQHGFHVLTILSPQEVLPDVPDENE